MMDTECGVMEPGGEGEWRKSWGLKSGRFATLCDHCVGHDQWVQCDDCFKRRRSSYPVLNEISSTKPQNLLQQIAGMKGKRIAASSKQRHPCHRASTFKSQGIGVGLADDRNQATTFAATTSKQPQHHPGCTCIECIQPPSFKGPKQKPTCMSNDCTTIHWRSVNLQKRKHRSKREETKYYKKLLWGSQKKTEAGSSLKHVRPQDAFQENVAEKLEMNKGSLDLNCHPEPQVHTLPCLDFASMIDLLWPPLGCMDAHLKQDGRASLAFEQQISGHLSSAVQAMRIVDADEDDHKPDKVQNDGA